MMFLLCTYKQSWWCIKSANINHSLVEKWINPFIPEFLKRTLPSLNLDMSTDANRGFSLKSKTQWQTVQIMMRRLVTSRLIMICTVCKSIYVFVCSLRQTNFGYRICKQRAQLTHNVLTLNETLHNRIAIKWRESLVLNCCLKLNWSYRPT